MQKWEYTVCGLNFRIPKKGEPFRDPREEMNYMGIQGWEVVACYQSPSGNPSFLMKRPLPEPKEGLAGT